MLFDQQSKKEKLKDSGKIANVFQNILVCLMNAEKAYCNLNFLNQKFASKIGVSCYIYSHS